jgi:hypothetical protein
VKSKYFILINSFDFEFYITFYDRYNWDSHALLCVSSQGVVGITSPSLHTDFPLPSNGVLDVNQLSGLVPHSCCSRQDVFIHIIMDSYFIAWTFSFVCPHKKIEFHLLSLWRLQLTHSRSWALLEKLPIVQPLKNFPAFYGTRRFITALTGALHWFLSWARSIQSIPSHPISVRSFLILWWLQHTNITKIKGRSLKWGEIKVILFMFFAPSYLFSNVLKFGCRTSTHPVLHHKTGHNKWFKVVIPYLFVAAELFYDDLHVIFMINFISIDTEHCMKILPSSMSRMWYCMVMMTVAGNTEFVKIVRQSECTNIYPKTFSFI